MSKTIFLPGRSLHFRRLGFNFNGANSGLPVNTIHEWGREAAVSLGSDDVVAVTGFIISNNNSSTSALIQLFVGDTTTPSADEIVFVGRCPVRTLGNINVNLWPHVFYGRPGSVPRLTNDTTNTLDVNVYGFLV